MINIDRLFSKTEGLVHNDKQYILFVVNVFQLLNENLSVLTLNHSLLLLIHKLFRLVLYYNTSHVYYYYLDQEQYNHEISMDYLQNKLHDLCKYKKIPEVVFCKSNVKFLPYIPTEKYRSSNPSSIIPSIPSAFVP